MGSLFLRGSAQLTGEAPGLQIRCGALKPSRVGSIPMHFRHFFLPKPKACPVNVPNAMSISDELNVRLSKTRLHLEVQAKMKDRIPQIALTLSFGAFCWLMMQMVHEMGHVVFAWLTGGVVEKVVLHPLAISRTDLFSNPHPLLQVWGGPLFGIALPIGLWGLARLRRMSTTPLFRVFAGFCCITNGLYIGFGSNTPGADSHIMLSQGCLRWQLVIFGVVMLGLGLWLLSGMGRHFGIGEPGGKVSHRLLILSLSLLAAVIVVELVIIALA